MTETIEAPSREAGRNYVGGAWVPASSGETYTKLNPMRPTRDGRRVLVVERGGRGRRGRGGGGAFADWAALPMARRAAYLNAAAAVLEARVEQIART